ncbi:hypothetical protein D3C76_1498140 [compost metagenome]
MQFKEVGARLKLMRHRYDPGSKRTRATMIGSVDVKAESVPVEVRQKLTPDELVDLTVELDRRREIRRYDEAKALLSKNFAEFARKAVQGLQWEGIVNSLTPDQVEEIWSVLDEMRTAMRKAGLPKKKRKNEEI